ncbi:hypothetical protein SCP_0904090 [Sparassis crispa]|uniref:Transcription factor IIIC 90kDa subunit N-terminal domain-containing protein n=1 Tax=Sparassis crispa TaxID=139825 RepID=A0A401GWF3_9APHY|nr:hypothetical protein SCP_0904090 [Sparassis crispa]GBE86530.1 hypothetical protein SCP_0904090 [Sparassis crispa]
MSQLPIFTALTLPGVSALPSVNCMQWTGDGQLVVLTKYAVYILTPDVGIHVEPSTAAKRTLDVENAPNISRPVKWVKTMIEYEKALLHQWPADCQEWGAVSLGSLDTALRIAAPSPSGLNSNSGSVIAVLNSNMELTIWGPVKNLLKGEWTKLRDMTVELRNSESIPTLVKTLQAQIICIGWSPQADFGLSPAPSLDGSLLAAGNRAGNVTFYRLRIGADGSYEFCRVATTHISDNWINQLAWSSWNAVHPGTCQAFLACGSPDGSVSVVEVIQTLDSTSSDARFITEYYLKEIINVKDGAICHSDGRNVTGMKWIDATGRNPILVYCKPGMLHLWSGLSLAGGWSGPRAINLRTQKVSVGASALCPASGISYITHSDTLVVSLSDGSFHVIHQFSTAPSLNSVSYGDSLTSERLTAAARNAFVKVEPEPPLFWDVNRINGMASYDDSATYVWIHESCRPTDFSYKYDAKHVSMFVMARLWVGPSDEEVLRDLSERIMSAKAAAGQGPISLLRPTFLHLLDSERLSRLRTKLLELVQRSQPLEDLVQIVVTPCTAELTPQVRYDFRRSLFTHLFGWDVVLRQRMRLKVAEFCQEHSEESQERGMFMQAANYLSSTIWHHVLLTIIRHVRAILSISTLHDAPFIRRVIAQASHSSCPSILVKEADDLSMKLSSVSSEGDHLNLDELCPACHAVLPLPDTSTAVCPNGHVWARCCITSFILSTPMVRTCVGCGQKAFLSPSQATTNQMWLPEPVRRSWLVQDLLGATRRCPLCASSFVALV